MEDYLTAYPANITHELKLNQLENYLLKRMKIYVTCPFDRNHKILVHGLQKHLRKCMKNCSITGSTICPFNNQHIIDASQILEHCNNCPSIEDVLNQTSFDEQRESLRRPSSEKSGTSEFETPIKVPYIQGTEKPEKSKTSSQVVFGMTINSEKHHTITSDTGSTNLSSHFCDQPIKTKIDCGEIYRKLKILKEKEIIISKEMQILKQKEKEIEEERKEVIKIFKNLVNLITNNDNNNCETMES